MEADIARQIRRSVEGYAKRPASDRESRIAELEENIERLEGKDGYAGDTADQNRLELAGLQIVATTSTQLDEIFDDGGE